MVSKRKVVSLCVVVLLCSAIVLNLLGLLGGGSVELSFLVIGDWGVPQLPWELKEDLDMLDAQRAVGAAMNAWATASPVPFIVSTGDHAYPAGLRFGADKPRLDKAFEQSYSGSAINHLRWYLTLGNHDCSGDTASQYEWALEKTRGGEREMTMKPYYQVNEPLPNKEDGVLKMFVLDMCTFVCGDMTIPDARCSASEDREYGHIGAVSARDSKERKAMVAWFEKQIATAGCGGESGTRTWCIVVGHWPAFSFAGNGPTDRIIKELVPMMQQAGVQAYFSGHDHNLQAIQKGTVTFFVSGAGGYHLHPALKPAIAEAAQGLNKGAASIFRFITRGFMGVRIGRDKMVVTAIDSKAKALQEVHVPYMYS